MKSSVLVLCLTLVTATVFPVLGQQEGTSMAESALAGKNSLLELESARVYQMIRDFSPTYTSYDMADLVGQIREFQKEKAEADTSLRVLYGARYQTSVQLDPNIVRIADEYERPFVFRRDKDGVIRTILSGLIDHDVIVDPGFELTNLALILVFLLVVSFLVVSAFQCRASEVEKWAPMLFFAVIVALIGIGILFKNGGF